MSTATFLMAFNVDLLHVDHCLQVIMSDNATTYTSAAQELTDCTEFLAEIRSVLGREGIVMEIYSEEGPLVWWLLGAPYRPNKKLNQKDLGKGTYYLIDLTNNCCGNRGPV